MAVTTFRRTSKEHAQPSRRSRVAYLTESFTMGGVERSTELLIRHLDRSRFDPIVICAVEPDIAPFVQEIRALDVPVVETSLLSLTRKRHNPFRLVALASLLRRQQIDVLHVQVLGGTGARVVTLAAWLAGVPVVIKTVRGAILERAPLTSRLRSWLLDRFVTAYTVASEDNRRLQIANVGRRADHLRVIYNAIDTTLYDPTLDSAEARRSLSLAESAPVVGTIGRLDSLRQKGIEYFLDMAARIHAVAPEARFLIVGDGPTREEYERRAAEKGLAECVTFAGYRKDVAACLAAMDVFVLASVFEPFGLVLAEAMAMQKPVIATCVGGIPEVVEHGETGLLVPPRNGEALAAGVMTYLTDAPLANRHGRAGWRRVRDRFSVERLMAEVESLYLELLTARQPALERRPSLASVVETESDVTGPVTLTR